MRLKYIEVFNAVMLTGTVSGAARLLHVTQPAVTQTLKLLELSLGYPLFTRQRNRLLPTAEGQALYPEVQRMMSQLESVRRVAKAIGSGEGSQLRVLIVPSLAVSVLPGALRHFRERYPETPVSIRTLHSSEIARAMALHEGDVGIVYGSASHASLVEHHLATGELVFVAQGQPSRMTAAAPVALEDVVRDAFIRIDERDPIGAMIADQCLRLGLPAKAGITVQTHHIAMVLAEEGFGPAVIDSFTASASRGDRLHVRTLVPEVPVEIKALTALGQNTSRPVADFIEALRRVSAA